MSAPLLSVVIPVYNSERTLGPLVERLHTALGNVAFEVVLVNDGSRDGSDRVGRALAAHYKNVCYVALRRNFGEFNAVFCGLHYARGQYVTIIDDDFQNPPDAILTLLDAAEQGNYDVVYSRYARKAHAPGRNWGSWLVNALATWALDKPHGLYLSSFKLIRQDVVAELLRYTGPHPSIDGLIWRVTRNVSSAEVPHHARSDGQSNYTLRKLISVSLTLLLGYSIKPLRLLTVGGLALLLLGVGWGLGTSDWGLAISFLLTGLHLLGLGLVAEYIGRLFMAQSGLPAFVVKTVVRGQELTPDSPSALPSPPSAP